ncbi:hypothetical protein AVEN_253951-1 [Araneus ventricosus]|uniref:Carboxylesterase type B domain-containing protein n=1 Tax=Araneus ventricosus TaxID=182803 RepID=A0A4Y2WWH1_ARAVE|nr:hypothetical protein AVEN_253951-1 [Araneus ventricosus]
MFMTSPLARGLFARAIFQSGSPANLDAEDNSRDFELSQNVSEAVGCTSDGNSLTDNPEEVVRCLKGKVGTHLQMQVNASFEVTTRQICHVKLIANIAETEYEKNLELELATYHLLSGRSKPLGQIGIGQGLLYYFMIPMGSSITLFRSAE